MRAKSPSSSAGLLRVRLDLEKERRRREADPDSESNAEFARCSADVAHFIDNYLVIDNTQGDRGGTQPFKLWPAQKEALVSLTTEKEIVFLKARQLGISWLCLSYALWLMLFQPGRIVLLFSQGEKEASLMLRRLKSLYERLPDWMKARLPARVRDNTAEQGWSNGSWCTCLPATEKAGRSFTARLVIMDEAAHQQWGGLLYNALRATVTKGQGQLVVVSSANGSDGFFDKLWKKAEAGLNTFKAIFLPWWAEPSRDQAWYDRELANAVDPELIKQEFPANSIEAFVASGRLRFHPSWVAKQLEDPANLIPLPAARYAHIRPLHDIHGLDVFELPDLVSNPTRRYILSADPAEGLEKGDNSDAVVLDRDTRAEVASFNGHWEPDEFARLIDRLAAAYDADILVERNNHGHAVLLRLKDLCPKRILDGLDERPGWVTSSTTKPQVIDFLAEALRDGDITVRSRAAISEIAGYLVLANGSTGAPPGGYDDRVMSRANAIGYLRLVIPVDRKVHRRPNPTAGYRG